VNAGGAERDAEGAEHDRLSTAVSRYLDAIGCEEVGDMPTILERLAEEHERGGDDGA